MLAHNGGPQQSMARQSAPPELVPGMRWRRVFPGEERQLGVLRRWLASLLPESPARDDLTTVATELATNTIRHTASGRGGWFAVEITWHEPVVRVAVADGGGPTEPRVIEDLSADQGRGLLLVRGLSVRTGASGDQRGRLVWADVRWEGMVPAAAAAACDPYEAAIRDGETALARRFAGVPAWFGRSTLRWWALPDSAGLVSAPSARELAALLYRRSAEQPDQSADTGQYYEHAAGEQRGVRRGQQPGRLRHEAKPDTRRHEAGVQAGHPRGCDSHGDPKGTPGGNPGRARVRSGRPRRVLVPALLTSGAA